VTGRTLRWYAESRPQGGLLTSEGESLSVRTRRRQAPC